MIETQSLKDTKEISENPLSYKIIGAAIEVHRTLGGPGLLEGVYQSALCHELSIQGLKIQSQVPVEVCYKGIKIRDPLIIDILVEDGSKQVKEGIKRVING